MRGVTLFWMCLYSLFVLPGCDGAASVTPAYLEASASLPALVVTSSESPAPAQSQEAAPAIPVLEETLSLPVVISGTLAAPPTVVRFAVIGDYGSGAQAEADVAALVASWQPDLVITTGDNNYPDGASQTIDQNIGQFYHSFIFPYLGTYGEGADTNRFFPSLGNHDWNTSSAQPYLDYFTLPGNERYYDFTWEFLHFFALDSDSREPDGVGQSSAQAAWLQAGLDDSASAWNVVYFHHAPYSSGEHGSTTWARWPYKEWGASVVLAGHDHTYERLLVDGLPYFVNGIGGYTIYDFEIILPESQVRYNADYGAMLVEANAQSMTFQFINRSNEVIDTYTITK